jgi:hypothetical protein
LIAIRIYSGRCETFEAYFLLMNGFRGVVQEFKAIIEVDPNR